MASDKIIPAIPGKVNVEDIITVNEEGKLSQIEVLIRPINALMAMAEHVKSGFKQPGAAAE